MARPRAADHDDKRRAILRAAAGVIAGSGYDRASMSRIAAACGVSKALLYHYYQDKETLAFDVIRVHLDELIGAVEAADRPGQPPAARLRAMATALLDAYRDADAEHKVQIDALRLLSGERQAALKGMERTLVGLMAGPIGALAPGLARDRRLLMPLTMSLFGMLNWHYLWFREAGPLTRAEYAELAATLVEAGVERLAREAAGARRDAAA
jgi:TetR/AcrR family transcriptional regulator